MVALKCYTFAKEVKSMDKKKVGVVCGGTSSERQISLQSGATVFTHLDRERWEVYQIVLSKETWAATDDAKNTYTVSRGDFSLHHSNTTIHLDLIFNLVHGAIGENGQLAALWELLEIPFSSCDSYNAALTYNKRDFLSVVREWKIPTAKHYSLDQGDLLDSDTIVTQVGLPCFIKANRAGSSFGVYKVHQKEELIPSIEKAFAEDSQILIESALEGREFSVGVAAFDGKIQVLPITEIRTENEFFDYAAKYEGEAQEITPATISKDWEKSLVELSKKIYSKMGLKGIVRSEYIVVNEVPHLLEINSVPGMTEKSIIPQQVEALGMGLSHFLTKILEETEHHFKSN